AVGSSNSGGELGVGLLFDRSGFDYYLDSKYGSCSNTSDPVGCTIVPKDDAGALVDGTCRIVLSAAVCAPLGE
ncbi:MAG: hypothetical protein ABR586_03190, partial [Thermoplasmatota archaeon]